MTQITIENFSSALNTTLKGFENLRHTHIFTYLWYMLKKTVSKWLYDILVKLAPNMVPNLAWVDMLTNVILAIIGLVTLGAIIMIFNVWRNSRRNKNKDRFLFGERVGHADRDLDFYNRGLALARAEDYKGAIRTLYVAMLLHFEQLEILRVQESWTHTEVVEALKALDFKALGQFDDLGKDFNLYCYSSQVPTAASYQSWLKDYDKLWSNLKNASSPIQNVKGGLTNEA